MGPEEGGREEGEGMSSSSRKLNEVEGVARGGGRDEEDRLEEGGRGSSKLKSKRDEDELGEATLLR